MSTSATEKAVKARHEKGRIVVTLSSGRTVDFPVSASPRLARGTAAQLNNVEVSPYGLHWPDLDEDLSTAGIIAGRFGGAGRKRKNGGHVRLHLYVSLECRAKVERLAKKKKVGLSEAAEELIAGA